MKTFFVLLQDQTETTPEIEQAREAYLTDLRQSGQLLQTGRFLDYKGNMLMIRAEDKKAAFLIVLADPYVQASSKTFQMYQVELEE